MIEYSLNWHRKPIYIKRGLINWRKWNNILHRDIGYLTVGLTIIFAISGIAVNHLADWNPNYKIQKEKFRIETPQGVTESEQISILLDKLEITDPVQSTFKPDARHIQVFLEGRTVTFNILTGEGEQEIVKPRLLLHDLNFLHLNHPKKIWTYFSDLYALCLIFLAVSGMFVLKGRKGLTGRGKWLVILGLLIPIMFLGFYKYWS